MPNPSPTVSVVLPYRNAQSTILSAVDSILRQVGCDLELYCIDDGSTDNGPKLLQRIKDSRLHLLNNTGQGLVDALNTGIAASDSTWIARMDADDWSHPERIRAQMEVAMDGPSTMGVVSCQCIPFGNAGQGMWRYLAWQNRCISEADHRAQLFRESPICHPSTLIRRKALSNVGGYQETEWAEDYDLWLRMDTGGWSMTKVPRPLFYWRQHSGQSTRRIHKCRPAQYHLAKAPHLAKRIEQLKQGRRLLWCGAGRAGKRLFRVIAPHGIVPDDVWDIAPKPAPFAGRPVQPPGSAAPESTFALVAIGAVFAKERTRAYLQNMHFREGQDFLCIA